MEFDAFGFYDFFFLFNSLRETFERVSNTSNCVPMFCPDISCFVFFIFTDEAIHKEALGLGSKNYFFLTGQASFLIFFLYKVCTKS